ncbi:MAG: cytochrome c family protein [Alphaproteobacteria bacterium]|nr:cytochrome c family protein [Alphaproteobacteria bacterium]
MRHLVLAAMALFAGLAHAAGAEPDPARGAQIYERCMACHSLDRNRTGPKHCGLFGRRAGSLPGYAYSPAMAKSGIVWDKKSLDRFLENPLKAVPGTKMGYAGVKDPSERADLIAYLERASKDPDKCE